jgi:hypothetical protein
LGIISGFIITSALWSLRTWFPGLALHPIGFAIATGYGTYAVWFSVFFVWAIKASLLRRGGGRAYRGAMPCFAGLIIGGVLMQAGWSALNAALGAKCYTCTE